MITPILQKNTVLVREGGNCPRPPATQQMERGAVFLPCLSQSWLSLAGQNRGKVWNDEAISGFEEITAKPPIASLR